MKDMQQLLDSLSPEERELAVHYAGFDLWSGELEAFRRERGISESEMLATTASQAAFGGDEGLARRLGEAALGLSATDAERQLAHVSLAQLHYRNRRDSQELKSFERHCLQAIELGHAGTFCYERLAVLYEYRGEVEEAKSICERAIEVLEGAGDARSARRFRERLGRLKKR